MNSATATNKAGRKPPKSAWKPGKSGNPAGTRNRATALAAALLEGDLEAITKVVIDAALSGDLLAAKFVSKD